MSNSLDKYGSNGKYTAKKKKTSDTSSSYETNTWVAPTKAPTNSIASKYSSDIYKAKYVKPKVYESTGTPFKSAIKPVLKPTGKFWSSVKNGTKQLNLSTLFHSDASKLSKVAGAIPALFGTVGQWANGDLQNNNGKTTGSKFLGRTLDVARNTMTGGAVTRDTNKGSINTPMNTGSKIGNLGADLLGMGAGFGIKQPGLGGHSIGSGLDKAIGNPVNKVLTKGATRLGVNATKYLPKIAIAGLKTGSEFGGLNGMTSIANHKTDKETIKSVGEGFASGALFGAGGEALGQSSKALKGLIPSKAKYTPEIKRNLKMNTPKTEIKPIESNIKPIVKPIDQFRKVTQKIETPKVVNPKGVLKPQIVKMKSDTMPLVDRTFENVGNKKVNAYQYDNPTLKPYISEEANILKGEIDRTLKPIRGANEVNGESVGFGNKRVTSESMAAIKDTTGASYEKINKALDDIVVDHGRENNSLSKKVELIIDDRLSNGYREDVQGTDIPAHGEYLQEKQFINNMPGELNTSTFKKANLGAQRVLKPINTIIPKSNMVSTNMSMGAVKAPNQEFKSFTMPGEKAPKVPKEYIAPTDANGYPLPDPKIVSSTKADKTTFGEKLNKIYTATVDKNKSISDFSKLAKDKTYTLATNSANQKNIADYIMTDNMVNKKGETIGKSLKEVLKTIPKDKDNSFMNYALEKHNIARAKEGKPIFPNRSSERSAAKVAEIEKLHPDWNGKSSEITKWISDFMDEWGVNAGTLDKGLSEANKKTYPNYIPTNRDFSTLEQGGSSFGGGNKGFVNQTTPIKRATGSARNIIDPQENIANMVTRTVKAAKNNEVGQNLVKSIRDNPTTLGKYAEIVKEPKGNVSNIVRVLENGKPTYVKINDLGLLKAMENLNKTDIGGLEAGAKKVTNVYKQLITQKNPVFAIRNIARDVPTAYVNGSEGNPLKFGYNLLKAGKDVVTNSKSFQQYKGLGGGGSNFFGSGNPAKSIKELNGSNNIFKRALKAIPDGIEKFNNITESAPRFSEFKTVLKKTGDVNKAMYAANDITTNFSRGGDLIKHTDSFVPYLNAGFQGLDKTVRQFKDKPIQTLLKGTVGVTAPTLAFNYLNKDNENYKNLDNRTKDNYFLIPNGDTFIKIPKSRELGVLFGSLAERVLRKNQGDENAFKGYTGTVATNFSPTNPIENNILSPLASNIPKNKDFADRAIVPQAMVMDGRSPKYQYDETTSELAKKLGESTNISPKQIDYIIRSYTGVIGQMGLPALTNSPDVNQTPLKRALKPITQQFVADPLYSNSAVGDFYDNFDKLKQIAADKNISEKVPSKDVTKEEANRNAFNKASKQMSDINKAIKLEADKEKIRIYKQQVIDIAKKMNQSLTR